MTANGSKCRSTFEPDEWCWFTDFCLSAVYHYKVREDCNDTYMGDEGCLRSEFCWWLVRKHD